MVAEVGCRFLGKDVVEIRNRLVSELGAPKYLYANNWTGFIGHLVGHWSAIMAPGSTFQGRASPPINRQQSARDERLNLRWFETIDEARRLVEARRIDYNESRPHMALGNRTPQRYAMHGYQLPICGAFRMLVDRLDRRDWSGRLYKRSSRSSFIVAVAAMLTVSFCDAASAQQCALGINQEDAFSGGFAAEMPFGKPNEVSKRHYGLTGKPCVTVEGNSKRERINSNVIEHWVIATNACGLRINVRICYFGTKQCVVVKAPPWSREETILGIFPGLVEFRCDYTEQF